MKKLLLLGLMLLGLGGVISVKAEKFFGSPSDYDGFSTWDSESNTMTWKADDSMGLHFIFTGYTPGRWWDLPENDYSKYETIHFNVSNVTPGGKVQLKIGSTGHDALMIDLKEGENYIIFDDYSANIDITKITEMTLWGAGVDNGSAVITDIYMDTEAPFVVITDISLGNEIKITELSDITDGTKFVISDGTKAKYFYTSNENENANVEDVPYDSYFYFTLEPYTGDDVDNAYWIKITNAAGDSYPNGSNGGTYLNAILTFNNAVISAKKEGWSNVGNELKDALWYVTYDAEKGFSFQNVYRSENSSTSWLSLDKNFVSEPQYLKLYESINFTSTTMYPANEEIFALSKATGYNAETGECTNIEWNFDTSVDISKWDYLMITTVNTPSDPNVSHEITIKDVNESVSGEDYIGSDAGTGGKMWLDRWNNQNAIRISINYLKNEKSMDITKIKSLKINGTTKIANVYLTDYNNTKINGGYSEGDVKREYSETGKFGTICLPYKASYAGAEIYSIASVNGNGISLEKVSGLLEAGKPYFYKSADENGKNNAGTVRNVNFFRADFSRYDAATPGYNNGLIGTFSEITAPAGANYWILSGNKLYDTEGCTGDDNKVTIDANRAYIDTNKITNQTADSRTIFLSYDGADNNDATAIESTEAVEVLTEGVFYDMSGREVKNPTTGIYIVKYGNVTKKVMIK